MKLLQLFCQLSNKTLLDSITNFHLNEFISLNLLTETQFIAQTIASIESFQHTTTNAFQQSLNIIIDIILGNQLMSIYETNWYFIPDPNGSNAFYTKSKSYGECSCGTSRSINCTDSLIINENITIDGMFIGCLPITSLRLSSLECFYNETCLAQIQQAFNLQNMSINSLNPLQSSQYSVNTSLNKIIDNLMLENWTYAINYTEYFNQCNLQKCTYSIVQRNNPLVVFTTFASLCE